MSTYLLAWRCGHCGRRGQLPRPQICPSGGICQGEEDKIGPQIHWLIDMDRGGIGAGETSDLQDQADHCGVAFWDGMLMESPE